MWWCPRRGLRVQSLGAFVMSSRCRVLASSIREKGFCIVYIPLLYVGGSVNAEREREVVYVTKMGDGSGARRGRIERGLLARWHGKRGRENHAGGKGEDVCPLSFCDRKVVDMNLCLAK
ncbi:hypothetical protein VNO77_02874 [Canavalia gladiata]|uniref:Uncharacterized protein n=1 Tax=Canavalia gladiata TaxID=3824 RepID=A0AAN9RBP3_CANGL